MQNEKKGNVQNVVGKDCTITEVPGEENKLKLPEELTLLPYYFYGIKQEFDALMDDFIMRRWEHPKEIEYGFKIAKGHAWAIDAMINRIFKDLKEYGLMKELEEVYWDKAMFDAKKTE